MKTTTKFLERKVEEAHKALEDEEWYLEMWAAEFEDAYAAGDVARSNQARATIEEYERVCANARRLLRCAERELADVQGVQLYA